LDVQDILDYLFSENLADVSRPTINRDVEELTAIEFLNIEATLLLYEQNNLSLFKEIFLEQCEFSAKNYFRNTN